MFCFDPSKCWVRSKVVEVDKRRVRHVEIEREIVYSQSKLRSTREFEMVQIKSEHSSMTRSKT
jgi:hypothetical protein